MSVPNFGVCRCDEIEQIEAVFVAGIVIGAVEVLNGVDTGVVGEEDGVSDGGVGGETRVFEYTAVEDEFEHVGVGAVPRVGPVMSFLTKAMVG